MNPTALGAYIFAGGFTLGVSKHFDVQGHLEEWMFGVNTAKLNFPDLPIHVGPDDWPVSMYRKKKIDFLYSNPPCASWSAAGATMTSGHKGDNWRFDPRTSCTLRSFSLIEQLRPKFWLWESVVRAYSLGHDLVDDLRRKAHEQGYAVTYFLQDLKNHGVAQRRSRFMMIAHRLDLEIEVPPPTREIPIIEVIGPKCGIKNTWVPRFPEKWKEWIHLVEPGEALAEVWMYKVMKGKLPEKVQFGNKFKVPGRPHLLAHRVEPHRPLGTVTSVTAQVHWKQARFLGHEELMALTGFPPSFKFSGRPGMWQAELAKGVSPAMGEFIARQVRRALDRDKGIRRPYLQIVDIRDLERPVVARFDTNRELIERIR